MSVRVWFHVLALAVSTAAIAQEAPIAIVDVAVVDVEGSRLERGMTVVVRGESIERVGPAGEVEVPEGARTIDGRGLYLLPGLFDAHVHLRDPETEGPLLVAMGVLFARDMGGELDVVLETRRRFASGEILGPELAIAGPTLDGPEGEEHPAVERLGTPEEGIAAVRRLEAAGVDHVKVYENLEPEVHRAILEEARRLGLPAVGHVPWGMNLEAAFRSGQASNEHLTSVDRWIAAVAGSDAEGWNRWFALDSVPRDGLDPGLRRLAESGMVQCPTLVVFERMVRLGTPDSLEEDPLLPYVPYATRGRWNWTNSSRFADWQTENFEALDQIVDRMGDILVWMDAYGVPIACGTDLGEPDLVAGYSVHDELALLVRSGLGAGTALRAATTVPARLCRVEDRLGTIAQGKTASMVLLESNPLESIRATRAIRGVFHRGRYLDPDTRNSILRGVRRRVSAGTPRLPGDTVALDGKVLFGGRYRHYYSDRTTSYDYGTEHFVAARQGQVLAIRSRYVPADAGSLPFEFEGRYGADGAFQGATLERLTELPLRVFIRPLSDGFEVRSVEGLEDPVTRKLDAPPGAVFLAGASATVSPILRAIGLQPGEDRTVCMVGVDLATREPTRGEGRVLRLEDTTLAGEPFPVEVYDWISSAHGEGAIRYWIDSEGKLLKARWVTGEGTSDVLYENR